MKIEFIQEIIDLIRRKYSFQEIKLKKMLNKNSDDFINIKFVYDFISKKGFYLKKVKSSKEVVFSNKKINIVTDSYPWIVKEIFGDEIYKFETKIDTSKKYTVLDIGANKGYAALYFAQKEYVKDIYAFELVPQTIKFMKKNLKLNTKYRNKIKLYEFGLGKESRDVIINRLENRDACNTIISEFVDSYMPEEKGLGISQQCIIKKASTILKELVEKNNIKNIILKIDVEGSEYEIIEDLVSCYPEIFNKICLIIGDTHLGFDKFYNLLPKNMYKVVKIQPENNNCCPFEIVRIK